MAMDLSFMARVIVLMLLAGCVLVTMSDDRSSSSSIDKQHYIHYDEMRRILQGCAEKHKSIARVKSIGKSVEGRDLWAIQISDKPDEVEQGEPMFKYVGNMHGNEAISRQILIYLVGYLCDNYGKDSRVTKLVNTTNIFILPSMNPDGFEHANEGDCNGVKGRSNANGLDLNRNFPDQFTNWHDFKLKEAQPETQALMKWIYKYPFVLSANLHGGSVVASYPFDDGPSHITSGMYSKSPDDKIFRQLAQVYAKNHPIMKTGNPNCGDGETFKEGITNGALWYDVPGGMQDFNYLIGNCFEITVELSCCKYPLARHLEKEWNNNLESLLSFMEQVHKGIKGHVTNSAGEPIQKAKIVVEGINHNVTSIKNGDYWRLLTPGTYNIMVVAEGYEIARKSNIVIPNGDAKIVNFVLKRKNQDLLSTTLPTKVNSVRHVTHGFVTRRQESTSDNEDQHFNVSTPSVQVFKKAQIQSAMNLLPLETSQVKEMFKMTKEPVDIKHHNYQSMVKYLNQIVAKYPKITRLYSIGKSVKGRDLWVMEISDNPGIHEVGEPEFRYIANMHGNEVVGRECLLYLMDFLCKNYGSMVAVTSIIDNTRIHLMPSMNPDGYEVSVEGTQQAGPGRPNANGVDLNRDFPDQFDKKADKHVFQTETKAVIEWIKNGSFVLSANLHGGALVVNYPFDDTLTGQEALNPTPDNDLFKHLAIVYSEAHPIMSVGKACPDNEIQQPFRNGITNGAQWYNVKGGMQDYNYLHSNDFEVTVEMGCYKFPPASAMLAYWNSNKVPLVRFIMECHKGVKGMVVDSQGNGIPDALIYVSGIQHNMKSLKAGDYYRLLLPGTYNVTIRAKGFFPTTKEVIVKDGLATVQDFQLNEISKTQSTTQESIMKTKPKTSLANEASTKPLVAKSHAPLIETTKSTATSTNTWRYHSYDQLVKYLQDHEQHFPDLVTVSQIGTSKGGKVIYSVVVTNNVGKGSVSKPNIGFLGTLHGYDVIGQEISLMFLHQLTKKFKEGNSRVSQLLNHVRIHIIPNSNVDGLSRAQKGDCNGTLYSGEDFYNSFDKKKNELEELEISENIQPVEVQAIKRWMTKNNFLFSAILEAGDLVVRYPLDEAVKSDSRIKDEVTADDDIFKYLAHVYASTNPTIKNGNGCLPFNAVKYQGGIVKGLQWKQQQHTLPTYAYTVLNSLQLSLHISCCHFPEESELTAIWQANKEPLVSLAEQGMSYIHGYIRSHKNKPLKLASITFENSNMYANVSNNSEFYKYLPPGTYSITAHNPHFESRSKTISLQKEKPINLPFYLLTNPHYHIHSFDEMEQTLKRLNAEYPSITRLYSIGESVHGRDLWVLEISDNPGVHEAGEPELHYVAGLHGNEIVGRELLMLLSEHLCKSYGHDKSIDSLVNNTRIHILPMLNPDGAAEAVEGDCSSERGKLNANGVDLNSDFGSSKASKMQPESKAVRDWMNSIPFTLSAILQGGSLVVSYPYDSSPSGLPEVNPTQDDDIFKFISSQYSSLHPTMHHGRPFCPGPNVNDHFPNGIVNGAKLDTKKGTMQDFSYDNMGTFGVTIKTGCCKYPSFGELQHHWKAHKVPLINFISQIHRGIRGFVFDAETMQGIPGAIIKINGHDHNVKSAANGDYWRLLLPGTYRVSSSADNYEEKDFLVHINSEKKVKTVNFVLQRKAKIMGIRPLIFVSLSASAVLVFAMIVYLVWRFCLYRKRRKGFLRMDKSRMYKEEFFDDMGHKTFNSKNLLTGVYSDESDAEEEVIFFDENRT
eukprot:gene15189-6385_t